MRQPRLYFISLFLCVFSVYGYAIPVLDPSDPQYQWMDTLIERDFNDKRPFTRGELVHSVRIFKNDAFMQHFIVKDNQVIGPHEPDGDFKKMLVYLCACYGLPDLELICYVHDGLQHSPPGNVPIFTRCRRVGDKNSILFMYGYGMDWMQEQCNRVEAKISVTPWETLINKVHWRGNTTDGHGEYGGCYTIDNWTKHPRGKICELSRQFPQLIDAAFVLEPKFNLDSRHYADLVEQILPTARHVSLEECLNYKFQILITGILSPWSSDWKLHAGRVIFRHPMPWEIYWDPLFQPGVHYIPLAEDYSDFVDKILWARSHDEECKAMAEQARAFMQTHAKPEHMALYCYKVLLRYAQLLDFSPDNNKQMSAMWHKKKRSRKKP